MEQKSQQQPAVVIKEEIADNNCSIKENNNTQRTTKTTLKGIKDSNDSVECQMKLERNSPPGPNFRNASSPKNINNQSSTSSLTGSAILKTALTNFPANNLNLTDSLNSPTGQSTVTNASSDVEQSKFSTKVKRLLSTLLQFANTLNIDAGESVKTLIYNLAVSLTGRYFEFLKPNGFFLQTVESVENYTSTRIHKVMVAAYQCNAISIEEFHNNLQEATNFPLRPFVLPFLRNYIPILQKEISAQAKLAKQNVHQYVRQHESSVLEPFSPSAELSEVFNQTETVTSSNQSENFANILSRKRRYECLENNVIRHKADSPTDPQIQTSPPIKKATPTNLFSPSANGSAYNATNNHQQSFNNNEYFHIPPPPFLSVGHNWLSAASLSSSKDNNFAAEERKNGSDSEWNNIYVMLNCILSMVEKTKRALSILQERNAPDGGAEVNSDALNLNGYSVDHSSLNRRTAEDVKRTANELMAHTMRLTEERVAFVRKKAEEAVNEVKRQAILELQKAIATTDYKITADFGSNHAQNKSAPAEIKKSLIPAPNPEPHEYANHNGFSASEKSENSAFSPLQKNNCWNCGRKAQETCSGCNLARYCGSFCQHKDWESHHQICNMYSNTERSSFVRSSYVDTFLRTNALSDSLAKCSSTDMTNGLRSHNGTADVCKLLPFSLNMTALPTEKITTRTTNSRPLTPVATTTSAMNSQGGSKINKK